MRSLVEYIKEEGGMAATPGNTMGMGNPSAPSGPGMDPDAVGSGDIPRGYAIRQGRKRKKKYNNKDKE